MATKNKNQGKITVQLLYGWNKWLTVIYALQGVLILILSVGRTFPVTTSFQGADTFMSQAKGHTVLAPGTHNLFTINLAYWVAAFLFMAMIAHWLLATKLRPGYERDLRKGINKTRWIEYAFSASAMLVAISLVVGVQDVSTLLMLFGLTALMNLLYLVMELQNQSTRKVQWLSYILGCIAGIVSWIVLAIYLIGDGLYGAAVPAYVYWIFGSILVLFACFPLNMYLQYRKTGQWTNYLYSERMYMMLSLVVKTVLAWQIFAGSLHP